MYITVLHYSDYTTLIMFILHHQTVVRYAYAPFLGAIKLYEHMGYTDLTAFYLLLARFFLVCSIFYGSSAVDFLRRFSRKQHASMKWKTKQFRWHFITEFGEIS